MILYHYLISAFILYFNIKQNGDWENIAFDGSYTPAASGPSGEESFRSRLTFNGPSKMGAVIRLAAGDTLEVIIQDNLSTQTRVSMFAEGHEVTP